MQKTLVALNERNCRIGESHHNARLTDHEVELIRRLSDAGMAYQDIADKFDISLRTVGSICRFERRAQVATRWKVVHV